jgi:hypothetical protein
MTAWPVLEWRRMNSWLIMSRLSNTGIQSRLDPNNSANRSRSLRSFGLKEAVHMDSECMSRWVPWGRCFIATIVIPCDRASRQYI